MAVFRIERTRDYTVMSNHHLRNANLSLKAKGLLSMMLSLPEDWNYTTRGLAKICKEGVDAIGAALRELEGAGYIVRHQRRDKSGRITDTEYVIYEQPQPFGGQILRLNGNDDPVCSGQRIDCEHPQGGLAVDEDMGILPLQRVQILPQDSLTAHGIYQGYFHTG